MSQRVLYLSHPQVHVDPTKGIQSWSLNDTGRNRVAALAGSSVLDGTAVVISSAETKAVETAQPLAEALDCPLIVRERMHENDRNATGYLPPAEFEAVADRFFAQPDNSVRGWETARAAQARIVAEVHDCLRDHTQGDVLFVGHGAVGTLLYCHATDQPIDRKFDQRAGGGCYFSVTNPIVGWRPMEEIIRKRHDR